MTPLIIHYNTLPREEQKKLSKEYFEWLKDTFHWLQRHHIRTNNNAGMGMKPDDIYCIPVSAEKHQRIHWGKVSLERQLEFLELCHKQFMSDKGI